MAKSDYRIGERHFDFVFVDRFRTEVAHDDLFLEFVEFVIALRQSGVFQAFLDEFFLDVQMDRQKVALEIPETVREDFVAFRTFGDSAVVLFADDVDLVLVELAHLGDDRFFLLVGDVWIVRAETVFVEGNRNEFRVDFEIITVGDDGFFGFAFAVGTFTDSGPFRVVGVVVFDGTADDASAALARSSGFVFGWGRFGFFGEQAGGKRFY